MKISVASMNGQVAEHFGHCEAFLIFDTQTGRNEIIPNPGHKPGFLPNFLADLGAEVIIAGGMGGGAVEIFNSRGMKVVTGAKGGAIAAAEAYSRGELETTGSVCEEHSNHEE